MGSKKFNPALLIIFALAASLATLFYVGVTLTFANQPDGDKSPVVVSLQEKKPPVKVNQVKTPLRTAPQPEKLPLIQTESKLEAKTMEKIVGAPVRKEHTLVVKRTVQKPTCTCQFPQGINWRVR